MDKQTREDPRNWEIGTSTGLFRPANRDGLEASVRAGITHLEVGLSASDPDPAKRQALVDAAIDLGMTIDSIHLPFGGKWDISDSAYERNTAVNQYVELLEEVAAWKPRVAIIHPSAEPITDDDRGERLMRSRDRLAAIAERAANVGIQLCVEDLPRTCLGNRSDEILALIDGVPQLAVCCDVNHLFQERPEHFIQKVGNRIQALHISDYDGEHDCHWVPGQGVIDWSAVIQALVNVGFTGTFMFEVISKKDKDPIAPQTLGDWWRTTLEGLDVDD